ncbi:MalY/PatB family protein [Chryseomicrobium sp. FSL W7-1435]|uniref:MalY/PatB family protein n=1 Tax=Chryseomicrobium sp. FSL W7-1435 TaxID=2921704 RepID=UPI00315AF9E6
MYDFTTVHTRRNTDSIKWDWLNEIYSVQHGEEILPMWVADMDFALPPFVEEALIKRIQSGVFGYSYPGQSVTQAVVDWLATKHQTTIDKDWLLYESGVIPSMALALQAFTAPGDRVLVHGPVYPPFRSTPANLNREVVTFSLTEDEGHYSLDFDAFEQALQENIAAFIFCNPHNPGGKVWSREDVKRIADLCHQHGVLLISDEIHADLVFEPFTHTMALSVADHTDHIITCMAPTKTFNLAGLQAAYLIVTDDKKREKLKETATNAAHMGMTVLGATAMKAAYQDGSPWVAELMTQLEENTNYVIKHLSSEIPGIVVLKPEATYLLWIDYRALNVTEKDMMHALLHEGKLALEPGTKYGPEGDGFLRMNIACPLDTVKDGVERFIQASKTLTK